MSKNPISKLREILIFQWFATADLLQLVDKTFGNHERDHILWTQVANIRWKETHKLIGTFYSHISQMWSKKRSSIWKSSLVPASIFPNRSTDRVWRFVVEFFSMLFLDTFCSTQRWELDTYISFFENIFNCKEVVYPNCKFRRIFIKVCLSFLALKLVVVDKKACFGGCLIWSW